MFAFLLQRHAPLAPEINALAYVVLFVIAVVLMTRWAVTTSRDAIYYCTLVRRARSIQRFRETR